MNEESQINKYLEASGNRNAEERHARREFNRLLSKIPVFSGSDRDVGNAAIQIKESLDKDGFGYDYDGFRAHEILRSRAANCLGKPLLIGALLGERGFEPRFRIATNPKDVTYQEEDKFRDKLEEQTPYRNPLLAEEDEFFQRFRFVPLEHLVIGVNGETLLETTSRGHGVTDCELLRPEKSITYDQALSFIYKDRAIEALSNDSELDAGQRIKKAKDLLMKGLVLWEDNREIHAILKGIGLETFDDELYKQASKRQEELAGDDSLSRFRQGDLEAALGRYPSFAPALAEKASQLAGSEPAEARVLFSVASKMYSHSALLSLPEFYVGHAKKLSDLFGNEYVVKALNGFRDREAGDFHFHSAMHSLTKDIDELGEACESAETPLKRLRALHMCRDTEFDDSNLEMEGNEMDLAYEGSKLYHSIKKKLNSGGKK